MPAIQIEASYYNKQWKASMDKLVMVRDHGRYEKDQVEAARVILLELSEAKLVSAATTQAGT